MSEVSLEVQNLLHQWKCTGGFEPLKELFFSILDYERVMAEFPENSIRESLLQHLAESPMIVGKKGSETAALWIVYFRLKEKLGISLERQIVDSVKSAFPNAIYVFSDGTQKYWHFVNPRKPLSQDIERQKHMVLRRISISPEENTRTASERLSELSVENLSSEVSILELQERCDRAFDVEAVTNEFFENYKRIFSDVQDLLFEQHKDLEWAHDLSLQFLNRLMFIYFIQRKRWIGNDPDFISNFWNSYKQSQTDNNTFYRKWLSVLFFETFNGSFQAGRSDHIKNLPNDVRDILALAPHLNGGLFRENKLDKKYSFELPDYLFEKLFDVFDDSRPGFFERYNFTITEDTPLDQEVAVNPEMIGKVYESLVNIGNDVDLRQKGGVFYTARTEIDLMSRLSLVDWLANHLGSHFKKELYRFIFAFTDEEKTEADLTITEKNLWSQIRELLEGITVLDPACGSGSFLVGMLMVIDDSLKRTYKHLGITMTSYQRRKNIIGNSLYGVDVKKWAVQVAELRLWLQLVVETEIDPLADPDVPLLPNLTFKIRPGDSLLQEIGGVSLSLKDIDRNRISERTKREIRLLKKSKLEYYKGNIITDEALIYQKEWKIFSDILHEQIKNMEEENKLFRNYTQTREVQETFAEVKDTVQDRTRKEHEKRIELNEQRIRHLKEGLAQLGEEKPFVWELAFAEIFEAEKGGFDIVIGNPPYVRQESIADPADRIKDKEDYKRKLQRSVAISWPNFFSYIFKGDKYIKLAGRSDLYIYFYFLGLSLLNEKGSFCFITSNSWLDVDFGKNLQEFLLKHGHVKMIIDNKAKRSFSNADINTIIALLSKPDDAKNDGLKKMARFAMFKIPFEEAFYRTFASSLILEEIEDTKAMTNQEEFRCVAKLQSELLEEGLDLDEEDPKKKEEYKGNKWGGKYLRAPDIYFTILEKGKGKFVPLGKIASVRRGITSGANKFFYLKVLNILPACPLCGVVHTDALNSERERDYLRKGKEIPRGTLIAVENDEGWKGYLDAEYVKPILKSPREVKSLRVEPSELTNRVFICHEGKESLHEYTPHTHYYVMWGERQKFNLRKTCASRTRWWDLGKRALGKRILWPMIHNDRLLVPLVGESVYIDHNLFEIFPEDTFQVLISLNSTVQVMVRELIGRSNLGEGGLKTEGIDIQMLLVHTDLNRAQFPKYFDVDAIGKVNIFQELGLPKPNRNLSNITREDVALNKVLPDRRAIDKVIFDSIGLTEEEQLEVYKAVVELVKSRLAKSKSVR